RPAGAGPPASAGPARTRAASAARGCALGPAGSPDEGDRKRASDAAELAFEVAQREQERGGAAVRAGMGMGGKAAPADEGGDLLRREAVASPHGGVAGHQPQQVVQYLQRCAVV